MTNRGDNAQAVYGWRFDWLTPAGMQKPFSNRPAAINDHAVCQRMIGRNDLIQRMHGPVPSRECGCGIHLVPELEDLMPWVDQMLAYRRNEGDPTDTLAVVARWQAFGVKLSGRFEKMPPAAPSPPGVDLHKMVDPAGTIRVARTRLVGPAFIDFLPEHADAHRQLAPLYAEHGVELHAVERPMTAHVPKLWDAMAAA